MQSMYKLDENAPLDEPGFSRARLLNVARQLEATAESREKRRMFRALVLALLGKTDHLSQQAMTWALICPDFLAALEADPTCWLEHTVMYIFGMAYIAWDMPGLDDDTRSFRIQLCEAVLVYSLGGEQLYLPFLNETSRGSEPALLGILAAHFGPFTCQTMLAFLANGAARRQFGHQFPDAYQQLVELALNDNDLENFFSLIAQQLGYKPRMIEFEGRAQLIDYQLREEFDPARIYHLTMSKR